MARQQNKRRIDHVAFLVAPQNFESCLESMGSALGLDFQRAHRDDLGLMIGVDWDAGIEILAPTGPESVFWNRLQEKGEGAATVIFGVADIDAAKEQARNAGLGYSAEIGLRGDEPWADRFEIVREAALDPICGISLVLGEIKPRG